MHWPSVYFGTAPAFTAAGLAAGIVLSTLASSADANNASPEGELRETQPDTVAAIGGLDEVLRHEVERRFGVRRCEKGRAGRLSRHGSGTDPYSSRQDCEDHPRCTDEAGQ
jgi:hypothetical protein